MSGAKWVCFCGGSNIQSTLVRGRTLRRGKWGIEADCADCGRRLLFTKHGMREIGKERNVANKYSELLQLTNLLGRQLINLLAEADTVDTNRLKPVAKAYQEFADNVQAVAMAAEVYK